MKTIRTNSETASVKKYDLGIFVAMFLMFGLSFLLISLLTGVTLSDVPTMAPTKLALIGFSSFVVSLIVDSFSYFSSFERF